MSRYLAFALLALTLCAGSALAEGRIVGSLSVPASMSMHARAEGCYNNPGPFITLEGELTLGGVHGRLIFRNNMKGRHERTEDIITELVILPAGETIRFVKQPSQGGVGGNPHISIGLMDSMGAPLCEEIYLGRCVQGLNPVLEELPLSAMASVAITTGSCHNSPGPFITLEGEIALGGLSSKLIFTNNAKGTHRHEEEVQVGVVLVPAGESISFSKSPAQGGVGGNPHILFQFTNADGEALTDEAYVGRCSDLR